MSTPPLPLQFHLWVPALYPSIPSSLFIWICLSQSFYSCTNIMTKKQVGRKGFIQLTVPYCCSSPKEVRTGTQAGQKAGADTEAMEGCYLLAYFPWLAQPAFLKSLRLQSQGWYHPQGALPPLITNWENALQLDLMEAFPQLKLLFLW